MLYQWSDQKITMIKKLETSPDVALHIMLQWSSSKILMRISGECMISNKTENLKELTSSPAPPGVWKIPVVIML